MTSSYNKLERVLEWMEELEPLVHPFNPENEDAIKEHLDVGFCLIHNLQREY